MLLEKMGKIIAVIGSFSPPKGIQVFATYNEPPVVKEVIKVSVPRRGFRSLLQFPLIPGIISVPGFSPPKGIQVFATQRNGLLNESADLVSVPRRGFRSLLLVAAAATTPEPAKFQSPEGDSGLCYHLTIWGNGGRRSSFSPPKGIQVFATRSSSRRLPSRSVSVPRRGFRSLLPALARTVELLGSGFSPPKGIQVFATRGSLAFPVARYTRFQSPEGDSGLCYTVPGVPAVSSGPVSVPRRGFRSLLLMTSVLTPNTTPSFSPPKGIQVFATRDALLGS